MTSVLSFMHHGVRAAIPAAQVANVERVRVENEELVSLWPGAESQSQRLLCIWTDLGRAWLACENLRLCELESAAILPLSDVLRGVLGDVPHVVGLAMLEGNVVWLVDVCRLPMRGEVE
jgi:hypothetical protein